MNLVWRGRCHGTGTKNFGYTCMTVWWMLFISEKLRKGAHCKISVIVYCYEMLKLSCSSTKPGDQVIMGRCQPIRSKRLREWTNQSPVNLCYDDPWAEGGRKYSIGATGYTTQTGETLSSLTSLCRARVPESTQMSLCSWMSEANQFLITMLCAAWN